MFLRVVIAALILCAPQSASALSADGNLADWRYAEDEDRLALCTRWATVWAREDIVRVHPDALCACITAMAGDTGPDTLDGLKLSEVAPLCGLTLDGTAR